MQCKSRLSRGLSRGKARYACKIRIVKTGSLYGESGLDAKIRLLAFFITLSLAACSSQQPAPIKDKEIDSRVRTPASEDSAGVQVYSLQNPAVKELTAQALVAERAGDLDQAGGYLERALRIEPRDPQLLQHMAEIKLQKEDYQQALNFAVRSYDIGPRVGEICSRNWRTISVAREHLNDSNGASDAKARATRCMNTRPKRL
jgi:tetratricopeptide (TPR) repeat protein